MCRISRYDVSHIDIFVVKVVVSGNKLLDYTGVLYLMCILVYLSNLKNKHNPLHNLSCFPCHTFCSLFMATHIIWFIHTLKKKRQHYFTPLFAIFTISQFWGDRAFQNMQCRYCSFTVVRSLYPEQ